MRRSEQVQRGVPTQHSGGRWRIRTSDFLLVRQALWASELTAQRSEFCQSNLPASTVRRHGSSRVICALDPEVARYDDASFPTTFRRAGADGLYGLIARISPRKGWSALPSRRCCRVGCRTADCGPANSRLQIECIRDSKALLNWSSFSCSCAHLADDFGRPTPN